MTLKQNEEIEYNESKKYIEMIEKLYDIDDDPVYKDLMNKLLNKSKDLLESHDINQIREARNHIYFSQHDEEHAYIKYLNKDPNKEMGTYIDIGSGNPVIINNTYYFYLRNWRGILIDPLEKHAELSKTLRSEDIFLQIAITNYDGKATMHGTYIENCFLGNQYSNYRHYEVECLTINTLIQKYPQFLEIDILNIDIESNEVKALSQCNFEIFKPKLICIEKLMRSGFTASFEHFLTPYYNFKEKIGSNDIYLRKK